jgi:hypothetical protein
VERRKASSERKNSLTLNTVANPAESKAKARMALRPSVNAAAVVSLYRSLSVSRAEILLP